MPLNNKYSGLFLPYVGPQYREAPVKIGYVGKANHAWGDGTLDYLSQVVTAKPIANRLAAISTGFIVNKLIPSFLGRPVKPPYTAPQQRSAFWAAICDFALGLAARSPLLPCCRQGQACNATCFSSIAWTNVYKVALVPGNPDKGMTNFLLANFNTLPAEIAALEPYLVWFVTGHDYDSHLKEAYDPHKLTFSQLSSLLPFNEAAEIHGVCDQALVIRTRHPQGWPTGNLQTLYSIVFQRLIGSPSPPPSV